MRGKLLAVLGVLALTLAFGVSSARADQINLGDDTCTGGPWLITTTPTVTGAAFNCSNDASFSTTPSSSNILGLSYSITPNNSGTSAAIDIFCSGSGNCGALNNPAYSMVGSITWTGSQAQNTITGMIDTLVGTVEFSQVGSGFSNAYETGTMGEFDLTLRKCSTTEGGVSCADPSSGQIPVVPEPASMVLFGSGLAAIAGSLRRRKKA